jgi:outer membrane biosynthesis protein TonB
MQFNRLFTTSLIVLATFSFQTVAFAEDENPNELAPENTTEMQDSSMPATLPATDNVGSMEPTPPAQEEAKPRKKSKKEKSAKKPKKAKKNSKKKKKNAKAKNKKKRHKNAA